MQQHISGKGNSSSVIANIVLKHQLQLQLIFSLWLLWNISKAISHSVCFSGKSKFVISFLFPSIEKHEQSNFILLKPARFFYITS